MVTQEIAFGTTEDSSKGTPYHQCFFILVMDVLNSLITKAGDKGLLQPLSTRTAGQRIFLYADDVALFIQPTAGELLITKEILSCFGGASGLLTNLEKSQAFPTQYGETAMTVVENSIPCPVAEFPCTYLGLPLSNKKLRRSELMSRVEKIADRLPSWKTQLMNMAGRKVMVQFVLSAIPIHLLIAVNVPKWMIKAINKIQHAFLRKGQQQFHGGCCLVAWDKIQRPIDLLGWALKMHWLWFAKTQTDRPWSGLDLPAHANVQAMFKVSIVSHIGNRKTLFWTDLVHMAHQACRHL